MTKCAICGKERITVRMQASVCPDEAVGIKVLNHKGQARIDPDMAQVILEATARLEQMDIEG